MSEITLACDVRCIYAELCGFEENLQRKVLADMRAICELDHFCGTKSRGLSHDQQRLE